MHGQGRGPFGLLSSLRTASILLQFWMRYLRIATTDGEAGFSLVVPTQAGKVSPAYWRWLDAFDADIIYSYVSLDRDSVLELHERLEVLTPSANDRFGSSFLPAWD